MASAHLLILLYARTALQLCNLEIHKIQLQVIHMRVAASWSPLLLDQVLGPAQPPWLSRRQVKCRIRTGAAPHGQEHLEIARALQLPSYPSISLSNPCSSPLYNLLRSCPSHPKPPASKGSPGVTPGATPGATNDTDGLLLLQGMSTALAKLAWDSAHKRQDFKASQGNS